MNYPTGKPNGPALTAFAAAIKARADARPVEAFDVSGFFGPGDKVFPHIGIRIPTKYEQDCALAEAHKYVAALAGSSDEIKGDRDIVQDTKAAFIAYEFCREVVADPERAGEWKPTGNPLFPGPKWLCENVEPERISVLINYANEVRAKLAPSPVEIDDSTIEAYASMLVTTPEPEFSMVGCSREYTVQLSILLAEKLHRERKEVAALQERIATLEANAAASSATTEQV